jgi:hypothetical protein
MKYQISPLISTDKTYIIISTAKMIVYNVPNFLSKLTITNVPLELYFFFTSLPPKPSIGPTKWSVGRSNERERRSNGKASRNSERMRDAKPVGRGATVRATEERSGVCFNFVPRKKM